LSTNKIASSVDALAKILEKSRANGSRVVMCHGVFDPIHPGHILHLQSARQFGDVLVVTVTADRYVNKGPWRPIFNEDLRARTLASIGVVDHVVVNDSPTAVDTIKSLKPDVYVKGADYEDASKDLTGRISDEASAVQGVGGRIEFTHDEAFSATSIVNQFFSPYPMETQEYLTGLRSRYSADDVIERLKGISDVKPLVVGEAIIDEYCYAEPLAKAPRESIIAAKFDSMESFAGGAVSTANHIAGFCDEVTLLAMVGPDPAERKVIEDRLAPNVRMVPLVAPDRVTVTKRRFLDPSFLTKLFEIQYLDGSDIPGDTEQEMIRSLRELMPEHDLVMVNDFGHGMITPQVREVVTRESPYLALNTQTNSANLGFNLITRYERADYGCIDLAEARLASGRQDGSVAECSAVLLDRVGASSFMITTGKAGATYSSSDGGVIDTPALSPGVLDRVGAGDAFFALTSPWVYRDQPEDLTGFIGNCIGALQVGTVGNRTPVGSVPLFKFITSLLT